MGLKSRERQTSYVAAVPGAVLPGESRVTSNGEIPAAQLWARRWITGHTCLSQEMGPRGREEAAEVWFGLVLIPVAAAQCKCT